MSGLGEWLGACLIVAGAVFFLAGSVGLLRFPDLYTRLHALTKADNLGLGLVVAGLAVGSGSWGDVVRLGAIWLLVMVGSATVCCLIARIELERGGQEGGKEEER
jgi:multicomponent Na+:H+ antiporter subunit G